MMLNMKIWLVLNIAAIIISNLNRQSLILSAGREDYDFYVSQINNIFALTIIVIYLLLVENDA